MTRRTFRVSDWAALMAGTLAATSTAVILVIGALALTGKATYAVREEP